MISGIGFNRHKNSSESIEYDLWATSLYNIVCSHVGHNMRSTQKRFFRIRACYRRGTGLF